MGRKNPIDREVAIALLLIVFFVIIVGDIYWAYQIVVSAVTNSLWWLWGLFYAIITIGVAFGLLYAWFSPKSR